MINTRIDLHMAFNNFAPLIRSHKREFILISRTSGVRDPLTSRFRKGSADDGIKCNGVFETVTEKDLKKHPDFELLSSDLKLTTTPEMIKKHIPTLKEKIVYNGLTYWTHRIVNKVHYGNYYIIFLKKEETSV